MSQIHHRALSREALKLAAEYTSARDRVLGVAIEPTAAQVDAFARTLTVRQYAGLALSTSETTAGAATVLRTLLEWNHREPLDRRLTKDQRARMGHAIALLERLRGH